MYTLIIQPIENQKPPDGSYQDGAGMHVITKGKGVEKKILQRTLFTTFLKVLYQDSMVYETCYNFKKSKYEVYFTRCRKKILTSYDSKRQLLDCSIHTLPYSAKVGNNDFVCTCDRRG